MPRPTAFAQQYISFFYPRFGQYFRLRALFDGILANFQCLFKILFAYQIGR